MIQLIKFLFILIPISINAQLYTDDYYQNILDVEENIIKSEYRNVILCFNQALKIKSLPTHRVNSYYKILKMDSSLYQMYFDTLIKYSIKNGSYESIRFISNLSNIPIDMLESKFPLNSNYLISKEFVQLVDSIQENDQKIRKESKKANGGKIYFGEYVAKIKSVDSINYLNLMLLFDHPKYQNCLGYIIDPQVAALWNHLLGSITDSTPVRLEKKIEQKALNGNIDKYYSSDILHFYYATNSKYHKEDKNYIFNAIVLNNDRLILIKNVDSTVHYNRKRWGLEPLANSMRKSIWKRKNNSYFFFNMILNTNYSLSINTINKFFSYKGGKESSLFYYYLVK